MSRQPPAGTTRTGKDTAMKRTALIAAALSVVPLFAGALTAEADPFHPRSGWHGPHSRIYVRPIVPPPVYHRPRFYDRFHFRRDWHPAPRPYWRWRHGY